MVIVIRSIPDALMFGYSIGAGIIFAGFLVVLGAKIYDFIADRVRK